MEGKVIAITGGASGIGLATAKLLSSRGAHVALADVQKEALDKAASAISSSGGKVLVHITDVRKPDQVNAFFDAAIKEFGHVDGAANLAGVMSPNAYRFSIAETPDEDWEFVMGVNATGVFNCLRKEMQVLSEGGAIVNAASVLGLRGAENGSAYTASKHAVVGLTKCAAKDGGKRSIRVNAIAPGTIDTPMVHAIEKTTNRERHGDIPIKRKGQPEEVAALIAFLLGDESKFITGSVQSIDGGWNI